MLLWLLACVSSERPDTLTVFVLEDGEYGLAERAVPELTDPRHLSGQLGEGFRGGYIDLDLFGGGAFAYRGGQRMGIRYVVEDGVGVPLDEDGLVLWTYYNTLSEVRADLVGLGIDADSVFPVNMAYQPILANEDFLSGENAAYLGVGVHLFLLLPDFLSGVVPLAANPGVVRHEFGHALFHLLITGDPRATDAPTDPGVRALNEGFADMVATLTLDVPDFFQISIPGQLTRDVSGDWAASEDLYPGDLDPYPLGTVYASLAWDLRLEVGPDEALIRAVDALVAWNEEEAWDRTDRWAEILVENAIADAPDSGLCTAYALRFPDNELPAGCS